MKTLLIAPFLIFSAFAKSPIEGGASVSYTNDDYIDVVKIESNNYGACSGTRVSPTLVITAAHCVLDFQGKNTVVETIRPGHLLGVLGEVVAVHIHPKYKSARQKKLENRTDLIASKQATLYDIAFIQFKEKPTKRTTPFPKLISESNKPNERKQLELAGYGGQETYWDGDGFQMRTIRPGIQVGSNEWLECPIDYSGKQISEIEKLTNNMKELLAISATRVHEISNGVETLVTDGKAMILSGDSGSPSLEKDKNGSLIVTGIASNIIQFDDGSGKPGMVIYKNGKFVAEKELSQMPENWGLKTKQETEFSEVNDFLRSKGLLNSTGELPAGVQVKRYYTRKVKGHYADLSHPENQKFIKSVIK